MDYYAPPPGKDVNQFASFYSNFAKIRSPWANELRKRRLAAVSPEKRDAIYAKWRADRSAVVAQLQEAANKLAEADEKRADQIIKTFTPIAKVAGDISRHATKAAELKAGKKADMRYPGPSLVEDWRAGEFNVKSKTSGDEAWDTLVTEMGTIARKIDDTHFEDDSRSGDAYATTGVEIGALAQEIMDKYGAGEGYQKYLAAQKEWNRREAAQLAKGPQRGRRSVSVGGFEKPEFYKSDRQKADIEELEAIRKRQAEGYDLKSTPWATEQFRLIDGIRDMMLAQMDAPVEGKPGEAWSKRNEMLKLDDYIREPDAPAPVSEEAAPDLGALADLEAKQVQKAKPKALDKKEPQVLDLGETVIKGQADDGYTDDPTYGPPKKKEEETEGKGEVGAKAKKELEDTYAALYEKDNKGKKKKKSA